jgi:GNAT superfamily N-acetyltransferase
MEIRALRPEDDRSAFRSGEPALDRFFHQYAGQNQFRLYLGVTYVAVEAGAICGYVTVSPRHVDLEQIPAALRKKLPHYPIPVLGLARLAVDESARSKGVGLALLRFALALASRMADEVGCFGVVVDAKPDAVHFYEKYGFRPLEVLEGGSDARPQPTVMWLPTLAIKKAGGLAQ